MVVRSLRAHCSLVVMFASLLCAAAVLPAAAQEMHAFNVSAQDPSTAIRAFAAQAHLQILASAHDLKGKKLNPIAGEIPTEEALNALLAGTGLGHRYVGDRTVALMIDDPAAGNVPQQSVPKAPGSARFANESPAASTSRTNPPASTDTENTEKRADGIGLQEIIVTARRHEEDLQKVPISITALTGEALKQQSVTQVYDLGGQIPGLFMQQARDDPQSLAITMRPLALPLLGLVPGVAPAPGGAVPGGTALLCAAAGEVWTAGSRSCCALAAKATNARHSAACAGLNALMWDLHDR